MESEASFWIDLKQVYYFLMKIMHVMVEIFKIQSEKKKAKTHGPVITNANIVVYSFLIYFYADTCYHLPGI